MSEKEGNTYKMLVKKPLEIGHVGEQDGGGADDLLRTVVI
jgi:hypothetical protein